MWLDLVPKSVFFHPTLCPPGHRWSSVVGKSPAPHWPGFLSQTLLSAKQPWTGCWPHLTPFRSLYMKYGDLTRWLPSSHTLPKSPSEINAAIFPFLGLCSAWRSHAVFSRPVSRESTFQRSRMSYCGATQSR